MARSSGEKRQSPASAGEEIVPAAAAGHKPGALTGEVPVAAIGVSAGGLDSLLQLLRALPPDTGMAFVITQHLDPGRSSLSGEVLARDTRMPIVQAVNSIAVEPNHVYLIPPILDLVYGDGLLRPGPRVEAGGEPRSIDRFLRSLAQRQGDRAVGVILSGSGSDGSQGIVEIKAAGGFTFAQDNSAELGGMPRHAIVTGTVDFVSSPAGIAGELARIARHASRAKADEPESPVLDAVRAASGADFGPYRRGIVQRRINRRMALHRLVRVQDYADFIRAHPEEAEALHQDILAGASCFFRDPETYEALKTTVFPRITESKKCGQTVRVWSVGCSSGEEAYSIAIAYAEYAEASGQCVPMQIFATGLDGAGIERARTGTYSRGILQDVSPERLRRFFVDLDGRYRVSRPIHDMCVFARHNLAADPPFLHLDMVACGNVSAYKGTALQRQVLPKLYFALQPQGFLWLGDSGVMVPQYELFEAQGRRHRIYRKRSSIVSAAETSAQRSWRAAMPWLPLQVAEPAGGTDLQNEELQSAKAELRRVTDELEAAKEELEASNEELLSINEEFQVRNNDLAQSNNDLGNLIDSSSVATVILDRELRFRLFTPAAERLLNLIPADVGRPLGDIRLGLDAPDIEQMVIDTIAEAAPRELEVQDQRGRWYSLRLCPYLAQGSKIEGAVMLLIDIDMQKRNEMALRESEQHLLAADRQKNEFLAVMAHELRNPLAAIRNAAQVCRLPRAAANDLEKARAVIDRQSQQMVRMVDDLLDASRMVRGTMQLQRKPAAVGALIKEVVEASAHQRESKQQTLSLSVPRREAWSNIDPARVQQVLGNLLHNASKFTPRGGSIWVGLEREAAPAPGLLIRVRDNGDGMDEQTRARAFELFSQGDSSVSRKASGMGIGLALARSIVALHGGSLSASSKGPGLGSEFQVRLAEDRPPAGGTPASSTTLLPRRILVIDDELDPLETLQAVLRLAGHTVEVCHQPQAAVAAALRRPPEVILLDIAMPGMDGYEVARQLRLQPALRGTLVIGLSGYGGEKHLRRSREAGFDQQLVKPLDVRQFHALLEQLSPKP